MPLTNPDSKYLEPNQRGSFANYAFDSAYFFYYLGIQPFNVDKEMLNGVIPTVSGLTQEPQALLINKAVLSAKAQIDLERVKEYLGKNPGDINID